MVGGKNFDIFILLCLTALFGMKNMTVLAFHQHLVFRVVGFCMSYDVF